MVVRIDHIIRAPSYCIYYMPLDLAAIDVPACSAQFALYALLPLIKVVRRESSQLTYTRLCSINTHSPALCSCAQFLLVVHMARAQGLVH